MRYSNAREIVLRHGRWRRLREAGITKPFSERGTGIAESAHDTKPPVEGTGEVYVAPKPETSDTLPEKAPKGVKLNPEAGADLKVDARADSADSAQTQEGDRWYSGAWRWTKRKGGEARRGTVEVGKFLGRVVGKRFGPLTPRRVLAGTALGAMNLAQDTLTASFFAAPIILGLDSLFGGGVLTSIFMEKITSMGSAVGGWLEHQVYNGIFSGLGSYRIPAMILATALVTFNIGRVGGAIAGGWGNTKKWLAREKSKNPKKKST